MMSMAWTYDRSPRTKKARFCQVGVSVNDVARLPGPNIRFTDPSAGDPLLAMYSHRNGSEKPCRHDRLTRIAPPWVEAPFATPIAALVGTLEYCQYGWMIQGALLYV